MEKVLELFSRVREHIKLGNEDSSQGTITQRFIVMDDNGRFLPIGLEEICNTTKLHPNDEHERRPIRDPEGYDHDQAGVNFYGFGFQTAENAYCALMDGEYGESKHYVAYYTIGRYDAYGGLAFALYDKTALDRCDYIKIGNQSFLRPTAILTISVCRSYGNRNDDDLARLSFDVVPLWCHENGLYGQSQLITPDQAEALKRSYFFDYP